jgi:hypothetical protein
MLKISFDNLVEHNKNGNTLTENPANKTAAPFQQLRCFCARVNYSGEVTT